MIKIIHYDIYIDYGKGWVLYERLTSEQRPLAYSIAKSTENHKLPIKIVKEIFDVKDGQFTEVVEYISGLSNKRKKAVLRDKNVAIINIEENTAHNDVKEDSDKKEIFLALIKLLTMIILGLIITNVVIVLLYPLVEAIVPLENMKKIMFFIFFLLFMVITIPLLLKNVPWDVFLIKQKAKRDIAKEKKVFSRALDIMSLYSMNRKNPYSVAPVSAGVSVENKNDAVNLLSIFLSSLENFNIKDDFSKLGLKLAMYGGCMEIAKDNNLTLSKANGLLYEVFGIIDGEDKVDLEKFYEAKNSYKDNNIAVYLTGVGAYSMHDLAIGKTVNKNMLDKTFQKWVELRNVSNSDEYKNNITSVAKNLDLDCIVSVKSMIRFEDSHTYKKGKDENDIERVREDIRNLIFNLVKRYDGEKFVEEDDVASIKFKKSNNAIKFAIDLLKDIETYQESVSKMDMIFYNTCNIIEYLKTDDINDYIHAIFEHNYNNELILTSKVYEYFSPEDYKFEFLGEKRFEVLDKDIGLYRINY